MFLRNTSDGIIANDRYPPIVRLRNGATSLTSIFDDFILPFLARSDKTAAMNPAKSPEA